MILEPFTQSDWQTFAGCETSNPLISRLQTEDAAFVLIVDGCNIEAIFMDSNGFLNDTTVTGKFTTTGQAMLFGLQVKGNEKPVEIVTLGETYNGEMTLWQESLQAGRV